MLYVSFERIPSLEEVTHGDLGTLEQLERFRVVGTMTVLP